MFALVSEYVDASGEKVRESSVFTEKRVAKEEYESLIELAIVGERIKLFEMKEIDCFQM